MISTQLWYFICSIGLYLYILQIRNILIMQYIHYLCLIEESFVHFLFSFVQSSRQFTQLV